MSELIIGGDSAIGGALACRLSEIGRSPLTTSRRKAGSPLFLDLADVRGWQPPENITVAYLTAAMTSLAACEDDPARARVVNIVNTVAIARTLLEKGARIVFLSTNLVFDGETPRTPAEAKPAPETAYGRQKAEAERLLMEGGSHVSILRLSKVISARLSLLSSWATRIREGHTITAFSDLKMAPVEQEKVADLIVKIGESGRSGLYQYSADDDISYETAARHLATLMGRPDAVQATTSATAGVRTAARSRHSTLDCSRIEAEFGISAPAPLKAIEAVTQQLVRAAR